MATNPRGVDLHARSAYVCILDQAGEVQVHQNLRASPEAFLQLVAPYRQDIAVAAECMFSWYWLADLCEREGIPFVLGHALYMKAIHAHKIAALLRHIQNTTSQYNLPAFEKNIAYGSNRAGLPDHFGDPSVRKSIEVGLALMELYILRTVPQHDPNALYRLRTVPGIGKIHDIRRFPTVQDFASYARLVKCAQEPAGKRTGTSGKKIGNAAQSPLHPGTQARENRLLPAPPRRGVRHAKVPGHLASSQDTRRRESA